METRSSKVVLLIETYFLWNVLTRNSNSNRWAGQIEGKSLLKYWKEKWGRVGVNEWRKEGRAILYNSVLTSQWKIYRKSWSNQYSPNWVRIFRTEVPWLCGSYSKLCNLKNKSFSFFLKEIIITTSPSKTFLSIIYTFH